MSLLEIQDLCASVEDKPILKGISLCLDAGKICAVMGQNGSGKSTLAHVIAGNPTFAITRGQVFYDGKDLAAFSPAERAQQGIFLSFQTPIDLPGVRVMSFLHTALNACRKAQGKEELNPADFLRLVREKAVLLDITEAMLRREMNVGFSGGERKRFEALQMLLLEPKLILLDEIDSGLDVDGVEKVLAAIQHLHAQGSAILLITHYHSFLAKLAPSAVYVFQEGVIERSGGQELALSVESEGYQRNAAQ